MRLNIKIDKDYQEPEALITTASMSDEVNRVVDFIKKADIQTPMIVGIKDNRITLL